MSRAYNLTNFSGVIHPCVLAILGVMYSGVMCSSSALANDKIHDKTEDMPMAHLGVLTLYANPNQTANIITDDDIQERNASNVAEAVSWTSGVTLSNNNRNEQKFSVRGFNERQVPVYLDGIPLYVPYDGYVDFGRFTTFDLSEVRIDKADASLLYGANALGGAVNLVSKKPTKEFEGNVQIGVGGVSKKMASVNIGGNHDTWYYQLGASYLKADSFPLPKDFVDHKKQPTDTGSERVNADKKDSRVSIKLGHTPNATDEYVLGYVRQDGKKGNPIYTGTSTQKNAVRYWRWPYWDKDSLYMLTKTSLTPDNMVKTRLYRDTYKNGLDMYKDATFTKHDPTSAYDDTSYGASVEWVNTSLTNHDISMSAQYKQDKHQEDNEHYQDAITSIALQDKIMLPKNIIATLGISHDMRHINDAKRTEQGVTTIYPKEKTNATNVLAKLSHQMLNGNEVYGVVSQKTRFPTIKDRYSFRMGRAIPNPYLAPEKAVHYELGWIGKPWQNGLINTAVFYSDLTNEIQNDVVASTQCGGKTCNQAKNIGKSRHQGFEIELTQDIIPTMQVQGVYTYLDRKNKTDESKVLTDSPKQRFLAGINWRAVDNLQVRGEIEAETGRYVSYAASGGQNTRQLGGFGTVNLRVRYTPTTNVNIDFGVTNVSDKWYELADGLPMEGRNWYAKINHTF